MSNFTRKQPGGDGQALPDDELNGVAGGGGSYTYVNDGERIAGQCSHPEAPAGYLKRYLPSGMACDYGQAEGAATCYECPYLAVSVDYVAYPG